MTIEPQGIRIAVPGRVLYDVVIPNSWDTQESYDRGVKELCELYGTKGFWRKTFEGEVFYPAHSVESIEYRPAGEYPPSVRGQGLIFVTA